MIILNTKVKGFVCRYLGMSATQTSGPFERTLEQWFPQGKCQCGCGADVKGSFKQGHDQRLKGQLLRRVRNRTAHSKTAARRLVAMGWACHLSTEDRAWAAFFVRTRHAGTGQFVRSAHVEDTGLFVTAEGVSHSHDSCPALQGEGTLEAEATGWLCGTCVRVGNDTGWVV